MENLIDRLYCFNILNCTSYIKEKIDDYVPTQSKVEIKDLLPSDSQQIPTHLIMSSMPTFKSKNTFTVRGKKIEIDNNFIE